MLGVEFRRGSLCAADIKASARTKMRAMAGPYNTSRFSPVPKLAQIVRIPPLAAAGSSSVYSRVYFATQYGCSAPGWQRPGRQALTH
jgi:hypothetical protein